MHLGTSFWRLVSAACRAPAGRSSLAWHSGRRVGAAHFFSSAAAATGSGAPAENLMLLRDFIQQSLYHPARGYFSQTRAPVGRLPEPIAFQKLVGQAEYRTLLSRLYRELQVDWLTPVEIFRPWYGATLAHFMLEARRHGGVAGSDEPLVVVEVGGGTGTLAASIMDHVREHAPDVYAGMSYTTLEISATLAVAQERVVRGEAGHVGDVWRVVVGDAASAETWAAAAATAPQWQRLRYGSSLAQQHCFVVAMEVLDNLPHDRVVRLAPDEPWQQTMVACASADQQGREFLAELLVPADDSLVLRCIDAAGTASAAAPGQRLGPWVQRLVGWVMEAGPTVAFLPTRCLQLLDTLHACRPRHTLLASDFDALPDVTIAGRSAPLVSSRPAPGKVTDHSTLYVPWGAADIFFPTDFELLCTLYKAAAASAASGGRAGTNQAPGPSSGGAGQRGATAAVRRQLHASHTSTGDFMSQFSESKRTSTLSGWNPMTQDWPNTRMFVGSSKC